MLNRIDLIRALIKQFFAKVGEEKVKAPFVKKVFD